MENKMIFLPLFVISLVSIGFEIALTRYFAIANWSEYGYWVISIAMTGFAASGVVLSLFKDFFEKRLSLFFERIPIGLMASASLGYFFVTINPFNPLELQNPLLWWDQFLNIGKYYLALFPFFFLTGAYIGLSFLRFQQRIPAVYAVDLAGAGAGAVLILVLMLWVHPFYLPAALVSFLAAVGCLTSRKATRIMALVLFVVCEVLLLKFNKADFNEYKSIYPATHVEGNQIIEDVKSPRGYFMVLDNFLERLDVDISNNAGLLKAGRPPETDGLYKDGNRLTSLPKKANPDMGYVAAMLDSGPYLLFKSPRVLLIGTRGASRIAETLSLGASSVKALEPDSTIYTLLQKRLRRLNDQPWGANNIQWSSRSPVEIGLAEVGLRKDQAFDVIDISSDFLDQSFSNRFAFTQEAVQHYLQNLAPAGVLSLPVSIREFTVYAVKMAETVRQALLKMGVSHPEKNILVYRSAWNVRILVSMTPFDPERVQKIRNFCNVLSFDVSYFPGINPQQMEVWNDLPPLSLNANEPAPSGNMPGDALTDQYLKLFGSQNEEFLKTNFFNLNPVTFDRPFYYYILRIPHLDAVLQNIALIPREEIGYLINLAVLGQAILLAIVVLFLPLVRWRKNLPRGSSIVKSALYFSGLALGFLFLEILLIDKASFYLNDNTSAFAVVLTGMLVFSGVGSFLAGIFSGNPRTAVQKSVIWILLWCILVFLFLDKLFLALLGLPFPAKCVVVVLVTAPLSVALGFPFSLGLSLFQDESSRFLPWAWSLNGAFSVAATPLANLVVISWGYKMLLFFAVLLYLLVYFCYPLSNRIERNMKAS